MKIFNRFDNAGADPYYISSVFLEVTAWIRLNSHSGMVIYLTINNSLIKVKPNAARFGLAAVLDLNYVLLFQVKMRNIIMC